jgi:signal transduction histidine kinase
MRTRVRDIPVIVGLAAVYVASAQLGFEFDAVSGFATLVWPPTGISLAAVLLLGARVWPGVFIGAAIANIWTGATPAVGLGIALGNTLQTLFAAYLLGRVRGFTPTLENARSAVGLIAGAAVMSTLISTTIGVGSLHLGGIVTTSQLTYTWRAWWIGDMVGVLLIAPPLLTWFSRPRVSLQAKGMEIAAFCVSVVIVSVTTFFSGLPSMPRLPTAFHHMDLLFVVLVWAALRLGQRVAMTAALVISGIAVAGTTQGYGPFAMPDVQDSLLSLQTFMALVAANVLLLGAIIAERQIANQELQKARDEATHANLAKSQFLAVMSHELRTPLNAIAGYSELLESAMYGEMTPKQREVVGRIHRSEERLLELVNEVLAYAQAEKGEVTVKTDTVQVAEVFDAVESLVEPELRRKHFVFKRDLERPTLAVRADAENLQQILVSLLSNASKHTSDGGVITLGAEPEDKRVRIWVADTGAGIDEKDIHRVFEPFFQTNGGTTRQATGVGLGLSIARDLARRMEGDVTIASEPGSGTTASVVLPAA